MQLGALLERLAELLLRPDEVGHVVRDDVAADGVDGAVDAGLGERSELRREEKGQ